jgi:light-regulated signal transduction histidine kinase (bacteriophytochrome)
LLEVSRLDRRKNPFVEMDIIEVIQEVRARLEFAIKERNAEVVVVAPLPHVYGDRVRLTEVFANLVSNALKYIEKPIPHIEIGCHEKHGMYEFYVKDNGVGIDKKYYTKIFEIFQRLDRTKNTEGTGAGLTIVKKVVEMHQGKVWVESIVAEGSTFFFSVPVDLQSRLQADA